MDISSDEADDWFMESLHIYRDLHVFQLEHPTKVIEWTGEKSICVADYSSARNEILELLLPLKLYAGGNKGLCPERDFKLQHGGFCDEPVECLRHIFGKRCVVTSGQYSSKLQVWDIGEGDSGTDSLDAVSGLQFVNSSTFVVCANNGTLYVGDTRDPRMKHYVLHGSMSGSHWVFALRKDQPHSDPAACTVARLSSFGQVLVSDLRNLCSPVRQAQLNLQQNMATCDFLNVTWAPVLDSCLAVSGFDGKVHIFDTTSWSTVSQTPQPVFVHRGHDLSHEAKTDGTLLVVTTHVWHPWRPRTLLSAASDGSIHVWDWVDKNFEHF
ncbi:WD repeat-containing protein 73 isoform X2 [Electrophorus electricus]|uniref:WD repeat-containing protein 73 isoform X2 n=1 Tax=Electrophorus electricus TaxID=8005 RepID=UPI0015D016B3|nr:WD repeat-containing protein 73 isoform X2 [Electrophorus electricus]